MTIIWMWVFFGLLAALGSVGYLLYETFWGGLYKFTRVVYLILALSLLYAAGVYGAALFGYLPLTGYGFYIRPVLVPILSGGAFIAAIHRRDKHG